MWNLINKTKKEKRDKMINLNKENKLVHKKMAEISEGN